MYQAENQIGLLSSFSTIQEMRPGVLPSTPGQPTLISQSNELIHIQWTAPYDNGGSDIKEYDISITNVLTAAEQIILVVDSNEYQFTTA
jgi:hypothetical protein